MYRINKRVCKHCTQQHCPRENTETLLQLRHMLYNICICILEVVILSHYKNGNYMSCHDVASLDYFRNAMFTQCLFHAQIIFMMMVILREIRHMFSLIMFLRYAYSKYIKRTGILRRRPNEVFSFCYINHVP